MKDGRNGGLATARKWAFQVEGQLWTKRALARHIGLAATTVRKRIRAVFARGERLTIDALRAR